MSSAKNGSERANANPSKSFFISMLTRDIDLVDCILDLLDNSVDGIAEAAKRSNRPLPADKPLTGHTIVVDFDKSQFSITDRSGGIPIKVAQDYAFRFGRPDDAPVLDDGTIGLYGIGMKRAIFKMGNRVTLRSTTETEYFKLDLDVDQWRRDPQVVQDKVGNEVMEWSFELTEVVRGKQNDTVVTSIKIEELYDGISRQFDNPEFLKRLRRTIARDYAFILSRGLTVLVNGTAVDATIPTFRESPEIAPFRHVETNDGVRIEITAGLADPPPDDTSANAKNRDSSVYGWYVVCNERVVVSADRSHETGWGQAPVPAWHPQFNGFMGVVRFESVDPKKLPWKTTKRNVETSNPSFLRALPAMKRATERFVDYTNKRKSDSKRLKKLERAAPQIPVRKVTANSPAKLPAVTGGDIVTIEYVRERADVDAAADALNKYDRIVAVRGGNAYV
jgi:hypothetical protein